MYTKDTPELTAGLSEALEGFCVAYRTGDDDFDGWPKIEEHADSGDQCAGGDLIVCLQRRRQSNIVTSKQRGVH